jgi:hypothetical protein
MSSETERSTAGSELRLVVSPRDLSGTSLVRTVELSETSRVASEPGILLKSKPTEIVPFYGHGWQSDREEVE